MRSTQSGPHGLYRRKGWFFGVCGGLADYFGLSAGWLRLIVVISTFITGGTAIIIYIALSLIMKRAPQHWDVRGERVS